MYANSDYYRQTYRGLKLPHESINSRLQQAAEHIDILTFNRINGRGFENLTPFQQKTIRNVNCKLAEWELENADLIETDLTSYSINGVSMNFSGVTQNGIKISSDIYNQLKQTGLCCLIVR